MSTIKTPLERFIEKYVADPDTGCWIWTASTYNGYGKFRDGKVQYAHIWSYHHFVGQTPDGLVLDHVVCDNRACVNPRHVKPVTRKVNTLRGTGPSAINWQRTRCTNGHKFDAGNTYTYTHPNGRQRRICVSCKMAYNKQRRRDRASS